MHVHFFLQFDWYTRHVSQCSVAISAQAITQVLTILCLFCELCQITPSAFSTMPPTIMACSALFGHRLSQVAIHISDFGAACNMGGIVKSPWTISTGLVI